MNTEAKFASFLRRRARCGAAWLAMAVFLMVLSRSAAFTVFPRDLKLSGRYDGDGPAFTEISRVRDQAEDEQGEPQASIAAWAEQEAQLLAESTGAELLVDAMWVDGPLDALWDLKPASGSLPVFGEGDVIALSRDAAAKLLGSADVLGQTVECEGKKFTVACVFDLPEGAAAPAADPGRGLAFLPASALPEEEDGESVLAEGIDCLFQRGFSGDPESALDDWFSKAGVDAPDRVEDLSETRGMFAFAAELPQLLMAFLAALILAREAVRRVCRASARYTALREDRLTGSGQLLRTIAAGLTWAALYALPALGILTFSGSARLPPACIPSRWSDLGFWPGLLDGWLAAAAESAGRGMPRPDLVRVNLAALACLAALLALPAVWFSYRAFRQSAQSGGRVAWLLPLPLLLAPASAFLMRRIGLTPDAEGAALWLPALFAAVCMIRFPILEESLRRAAGGLMAARKNKQEGPS